MLSLVLSAGQGVGASSGFRDPGGEGPSGLRAGGPQCGLSGYPFRKALGLKQLSRQAVHPERTTVIWGDILH